MGDFLGEGKDLLNDEPLPTQEARGKVAKAKLPKARWPRLARPKPPAPSKAYAPPKPPAPTQSRPVRKKPTDRSAELIGSLRDFQNGLRSLDEAIGKLSQSGTRRGDGTTAPRSSVDGGLGQASRVPPPIHKIMERELRILHKTAAASPVTKTHRAALTRQFEQRARQAVKANVPQTLAALLRADRDLRAAPSDTSRRDGRKPQTPQVVLRPDKGGPVDDLMKVAKSIRSGRLPFVPKETKRRAQELLTAVYGRERGTHMATSRAAENRRMIEQHRLIPLAVQHDAVRQAQEQPQRPHTTTERQLQSLVTQIIHEGRTDAPDSPTVAGALGAVPIAEHEARSLEKVMPRFRQEGAVAGSGPFIIEGGESMQQVGGMNVMYHEGSSAVAGAERGASVSAGAQGRTSARMAKAPAARNGGGPAAAAPSAAPHRGPSGGGGGGGSSSADSGGLGSDSGGGTGGGGAMTIEGELTIAGMSDWVAKVNGKVRDSGV